MKHNKNRTIFYLITQTELGGAQKYISSLAKSLKDEFKIIVAGGEQGKKGEIAQEIIKENIDFYEIPHLARTISPFNDFLALWEIIKAIRAFKPDIIHLNSSKASILGSLAAFLLKLKGKKIKVIYTAHGWVFNEPLPKWQKIFYKFSEKFTALFKDKIICVSKYDQQLALKEKIAPANKLITIHNGISRINFLSRQEAREKLNAQNNKIFLGAIGNLYKTKGYEYFIKTAAILKNKYGLPIQGIIIGEGKERKRLENFLSQYNLKGNIFLAGKIDNANKLLKAFDIYLCSSVKEGLSYTIMEAMQAGVPIVATDVGGNGELIKDGENGFLALAQNPENLAQKVKALIDNPKLSQNFGENARKKIQAKFTLEKMISETKKIYLELIYSNQLN